MIISKRNIFILILTFCLLFATACSSSNNKQDSAVGGISSTNGDGLKKGSPGGGPEVSVKERVLLDQDGMIITLKSLKQDGIFGPSLKVLIENNSEKSVTVQIRDSSINGVMADAMFSSEVAPDKKANDEITFMKSDLERANISLIKDIEFKFHIFDSKTWDGILDSDVIAIKTTADQGYVQTYDDSGEVVLEEKEIRIVMKRVNSKDSFWGADVHVLIENDSDLDATVQARDVSINGFMIDPIFSCEVLAGKKAYDTITFLESDLLNNDIKTIDEMELSFHIFSMSGWDTIYDSPKISVTFE